MLKKIFIQNYALIDHLNIDLHQGLQVITGETGAGKSIILGALRLILGERAETKSIQNLDNKSIIEAEFDISENFRPFFDNNDLDFEKNTIIRREILPSGKSRAFINDVPTTLDVLKELSTQLIDIHSQFETSNLFNEDFQFKIIDGLSANKNLISEYRAEFSEYKNLQKKLADSENILKEGNKDIEYKQFLLNELEELDLDSIHFEVLQSQLTLQENAEIIKDNLATIFQRFDQEDIGVLDALSDIRNKLSKVAHLSHQFTEANERLESVFLELKDILFELQDKAEQIDIDSDSLHQLKEKINKINALFLKHNVNTVDELIEIREQLSTEQNNFDEIEEKISLLRKQLSEQEVKIQHLANELSENRKNTTPIFTEKIESLLKKLGLEKAKMEVELSETEHFTHFGKEKIALLFQANMGFPLKPIQSAISGGERSRVMLAIKKITAENTELPTLILDEIDTGISGKVADEIGSLMKEMSTHLQLIVITHLAQVAAKGNNNYKVVKREIDGKTQSSILSLSENEKLTEIAQLLSGAKITDAAIEQAKELMK